MKITYTNEVVLTDLQNLDSKIEELFNLYPQARELSVKLGPNLLPQRFYHSLGTMVCAYELGVALGFDAPMLERCVIAGLMHDCAKNLSEEEADHYFEKYNITEKEIDFVNLKLGHSWIGSYLVKDEYGIDDEQIAMAIRYHTSGKEDMTVLEKVIFIADFVEANRIAEDCLLARKYIYESLDRAVMVCLDRNIIRLVNKGVGLNLNGVLARNFLLKELED